jgi:hypothetical protein
MKRLLLRLLIVVTVAFAGTVTVAAPASAGPVSWWPNKESCELAGQRGLGTLWPWYSCTPDSLGNWVLWAPGW